MPSSFERKQIKLVEEIQALIIGIGNMEFIAKDRPDLEKRFHYSETAENMREALAKRRAELKELEGFDPSYIVRGVRQTAGLVRTGARHARTIHGLASQVRRQVTRRRAVTPTATPRRPPTKMRGPDARLYADPAKLPRPDDHPGYDNLNNIRLVPEFTGNKQYLPVKRLIESQVVLPQHQWDTLYEKISKWPDVEVTDEDGDGKPDRLIRRGHRNNQTSVFIDRA
jgi:hypothetical protein